MGAMTTLGSTLGTSGGPANYSNFLNMPGYQFAVQQGTQAIDRQASATGNLYTPNTLDAVGKYVAGTAMGDYNTYVQQLMGVAGFGVNANQNIGQAQINKGTAQAGGYAGTAGSIGSFLGQNSSGIGSAINNGINYLGGSNSPNASGVTAGGGGSPYPSAAGGSYNPDGTYNPPASPDLSGTGGSPYVNSPDAGGGGNGGGMFDFSGAIGPG
jgi:hypothetical protein